MNQFTKTPMTREESLKILNYQETTPKEKLDPKDIMQKFEKYFESNDQKKGGSFYVQSKVYFAKEELMKDFPEYNISKYNPDKKRRPVETEEERKKREEAEKKETEDMEAEKKAKKSGGKRAKAGPGKKAEAEKPKTDKKEADAKAKKADEKVNAKAKPADDKGKKK